MGWLKPALAAVFSTIMLLGPVNFYVVATEGKPRFRAVVWLVLWLATSFLFAYGAEKLPPELGGFSRVIYIGLSIFFGYHAINKILFLIDFGKRTLLMDNDAVYVPELELRVPWHQLVSAEADHAGLKLATTLARPDWFVDMPQAKAKTLVKALEAHPNYRKLDPYVNVN